MLIVVTLSVGILFIAFSVFYKQRRATWQQQSNMLKSRFSFVYNRPSEFSINRLNTVCVGVADFQRA